MRRIAHVAVSIASLSLAWVAAAPAATLVPVGNFDRPIYLTSDPANPDRLLVVEREGRILVRGSAGFQLFGELEALVSCCGGERGLLSIAPAQDFSTSQRLYAAYTGTSAAGGAEGDIHVDAFRPGPAGDGGLLREPLLSIGHADFANHNGGQLQFGPDGYLYLSTGDGGGVGDPDENGQDVDALLGKILRIDPRPGQTPAYAVPPGNPFVGVPGRDEIWSFGLRNPWRFSFDRLGGDLVIADVGQGLREEIDHAPSPGPGSVGGRGANYGWNCREGLIPYPGAAAGCAGAGPFAEPVFDYPHEDPEDGSAHGCSISGGYVVRDPGLPDLYGRYLYADFCQGELRSLSLPAELGGRASGDRSEGLHVPNPVSFGEDACGRIYVVSNGGGAFRLQGDAGPECQALPPSEPAQPVEAVERTATAAASPPASVGARSRPRPRLRLRVRRAKGRRVALIARVVPCLAQSRGVVQLNRGGRRFRRKRLGAGCRARFRVVVARTATFRALFAGQRSQVRRIALAKPRP